MILKQDRIRCRLGIFSVGWIIVTSGGVLFNAQNVVPYVMVFDVLLVFAQVILARRALLTRGRVVLFALLVACVVLSVIANSDYAPFLSYARLLLIIALALGTCLLVGNEVIATTFVKVVVALAGISVFFFYSKIVDSNASIFPVIAFYDNTYVNAFIYLSLYMLEHRNLGIFIEPGLYQIYLNMALFILLYSGRKFRYKYIVVIVLLVALYSTKSTTGYIMGLLIISGQVFHTNLSNKNILSPVFKGVVVVLAVALVLKSEFFSGNIEEKFYGDQSMSYGYRVNAFLVDYLIISENPLTGAGVGNYKEALETSVLAIDASANTFSQLGAHVGLPFVLLILWRVGVFVFRLKLGFVGKTIFAVVYIVSFSIQPFVLYPLFYLPVFMSYRDWQTRQRAMQRFSGHHRDGVRKGW